MLPSHIIPSTIHVIGLASIAVERATIPATKAGSAVSATDAAAMPKLARAITIFTPVKGIANNESAIQETKPRVEASSR